MMKGFLLFAISMGVYIYAVFVEKVVWNWYMPETFGLPVLTMPQVAGITILAAIAVRAVRIEDARPKTDDEKIGHISFCIAYWSMGLLFAYLWRLAI
jgi:hypothetical protein